MTRATVTGNSSHPKQSFHMKLPKLPRRKQSNSAPTDDADQSASVKPGHAHTESSFRVLPRPDAAHTFGEPSSSNPRSYQPSRYYADGARQLKRPTTVSNDTQGNMFSGLEPRYVNCQDSPKPDAHTPSDSKTPEKHKKKHSRVAHSPRWMGFRKSPYENAPATASTPALPQTPSTAARYAIPSKQTVPPSTISSRTNHSAGSASFDSSSAREYSYPTTPSTQETSFEPPQPICEPHRSTGRAFSFGGGKPKAPSFIAPPKPTRMRSDTAATTEAQPPRLPDSLSVGFGFDAGTGHNDFNMHMFDHVALESRLPDSRRTPSPGSNVPQENAVVPRHDNSSSSSLKPPEAEKKRRSSFFLNIKNKITKNNSNTQLSSPQSSPVPPAASIPTASSEEPFTSGSLLANNTVDDERPAEGSLGQSLHTNRHTATVPLTGTHASGNPMATMTQNRRTWGGGNSGNSNINQNEPNTVQQRIVKIEADSEDDDDDDAPLFPPRAKRPLVEVTATSRSPSPKSPPVVGTKPQESVDDTAALEKTRSAGEDSLTAAASIAAQFEEVSLKEDPPKKVMTEAQYARLRQETAEASDDDDDGSSYVEDVEDDDDRKQKREAQQARLKQQAMLTLQRQRMLKVTDGSAPVTPHRGSIADLHTSLLGPSMSSPNLVPGKTSPRDSPDGQSMHKSDSSNEPQEDEDENVPLGILASHGFPNKRRPPSKLMASSSNPNLSAPGSANSEYFPQPGIQGGLPPALPVFARNLPQDPYYGAGLVNHNPRESLAMGGGQQPTGGLVGVIMNEERARASRRKSPNNGPMFTGTQPAGMLRHSVYGSPMPPQGPVPPMPQQPPFAPPMGSQYEMMQMSMMQAQMQASMQMMEFMSHLRNQPPAASQPATPQFGMPPNMGAPPMMNHPGAGQRTMSMVDTGAQRMSYMPPPPPIGGVNMRPVSAGRQAYAHSVAPSERSNVGAASRYRPVSMHPPTGSRSSTVPPANHLNINLMDDSPRGSVSGLSHAAGHNPSLSNASVSQSPGFQRTHTAPTLSVTTAAPHNDLHPTSNLASHVTSQDDDDDEDDEQAWNQMRMKRDQLKGNWKLKKGSHANLTEVAS